MSTTAAIPAGDRFRRFYAEVQTQRRRVVGTAPPPAGAAAARPPAIGLESVQAPLLALIRDLRQDALGQPGADPDAVREEQTLMAVFADHLFCRLDWEPARAWRDASLEMQLTDHEEGRDGILQRIDELLRTRDPGRRETARLYLLALCLGLREDTADDELAMGGYTQRLLEFAVPGDPDAAARLHELTPQAYGHTSTAPGRRRIPALRAWALAAAGSVLLVWVVSLVLWSDATRTLDDTTGRILGPR